jgi:hypothetical protein
MRCSTRGLCADGAESAFARIEGYHHYRNGGLGRLHAQQRWRDYAEGDDAIAALVRRLANNARGETIRQLPCFDYRDFGAGLNEFDGACRAAKTFAANNVLTKAGRVFDDLNSPGRRLSQWLFGPLAQFLAFESWRVVGSGVFDSISI